MVLISLWGDAKLICRLPKFHWIAMSGKKAVISGYPGGIFKAFSSQNLSSIFISFAWSDQRNE